MTACCDVRGLLNASNYPRALEVSIGIEILGVAARVGIAEEAGGGCADMCGGVAHACSFQNSARGSGRRARPSFGVPWAFISSRTVPDWSRNAFSIAAKSHTSTL